MKFPVLDLSDRFEKGWYTFRLKQMSEEEYSRWSANLQKKREALQARFNTKEYSRKDLEWYQHTFIEHFSFMYDRLFYDPKKGYRIEEFLDRGEREFGGYDQILLWLWYPRIGCDDRNQFDFYREMPGGLNGIRDVVRHVHRRGVKVFIPYSPWDTGTRREPKPDNEALVELVAVVEADGVFLDTLSGAPSGMREALDQARSGVVLEPELSLSWKDAQAATGSWGQFQVYCRLGEVLMLRWLEPRYSVRLIDRNVHDRSEMIFSAFFNSCGVVIFENVLGWWNPWSPKDRALLKRCVSILRAHKDAFTCRNWMPLVPTLDPYVLANCWPGRDKIVWTLANVGYETISKEVLAVPSKEGARYFDAWNNLDLQPRQRNGLTYLSTTLEPRSVGCIVESVSPSFSQPSCIDEPSQLETDEAITLEDHKPKPVTETPLASKGEVPPNMVLVPASEFVWKVEHRPREGACYDDISANWAGRHPIRRLSMKAFLIDRFPVTNADFKTFLGETGYRPSEPRNFLKHWINGQIPLGKEKHPVVYVNLNDARVYARWAGKRLPLEEEWQYAAQGTDGRFWPWGNQFSLNRCNTDSSDTTPVDAFPLGISPFGVWDMIGNVWEMTESERDDGHTRYIVLKGGSYYRAKGSHWYFDGGAQRCTWHTKFLLMWPGLDRCGTIGFRCVKDTKQ